MNALGRFLRQRVKELGVTLADVARDAGAGRQTLYAISAERTGGGGGRLPDLDTLVKIAIAIKVHPLRLVQLVFEDYPLPIKSVRAQQTRGDQSIFIADVTIPDGMVVMAGTKFTKVWEVQNVGTVPWENRLLVCVDDDIEVRFLDTGAPLLVAEKLTPSVRRVPVPLTPPGGVARLAVEFQAPLSPGSAVSYWKSTFQDGSICFPNSIGLSCVVRVVTMTPTGSLHGV